MNLTEIIIVAVGAFFLFGVMPAIISVSSYQEKKLKLQRELAKAGGADVQAQLEATNIEVERLRERVAVLEKLVTDDDRRISSEISRLAGDRAAARGV